MSQLQNNTAKLESILEFVGGMSGVGGGSGGHVLPNLENPGSAEHLLKDKELINGAGFKVVGTMPDNGTVSLTMDGVNTKSVTVPAGYTSGGTVSLDDTIDDELTVQTELLEQAASDLEQKSEMIYNEAATQEELLEQAALTLEGKAAGGGSGGLSLEEVLQSVYPVGAFYMSAVSTSPQTTFGFGTWVQIEDRFLLAAGSTYSAGSTGGEAEHTLTIEEIPSHNHDIIRPRWGTNTGANAVYGSNGTGSGSDYDDRGYAGGDQPHNNMPPYLAVYVWQRTA